jgi:hypothetical protein
MYNGFSGVIVGSVYMTEQIYSSSQAHRTCPRGILYFFRRLNYPKHFGLIKVHNRRVFLLIYIYINRNNRMKDANWTKQYLQDTRNTMHYRSFIETLIVATCRKEWLQRQALDVDVESQSVIIKINTMNKMKYFLDRSGKTYTSSPKWFRPFKTRSSKNPLHVLSLLEGPLCQIV